MMIKCVNDECSYFKEYGECSSVCIQQGFKKIITNYDRIRNMSIEEMAEFLESTNPVIAIAIDGKPIFCSKERIKQWLESEVTE